MRRNGMLFKKNYSVLMTAMTMTMIAVEKVKQKMMIMMIMKKKVKEKDRFSIIVPTEEEQPRVFLQMATKPAYSGDSTSQRCEEEMVDCVVVMLLFVVFILFSLFVVMIVVCLYSQEM
jgi:hypothetical protein